MFNRKFKIKTSTTVKGSERRKFRCLLESQYPSLSADDISSLIPAKSEMTHVKVLTHSGSVAMIYCCANNPIFFQVENHVYPTVYTLWKFPNLLPTLTTVPVVLDKFNNGADLMTPGIVFNDAIISEFHNLKVNDVCAVRIIGNKAPIAVGLATLSDAEVREEGRRGKAVLITHCYKDNLWSSGDQTHPPLITDDIDTLDEDTDDADDSSESNDNLEETVPNESKDDTIVIVSGAALLKLASPNDDKPVQINSTEINVEDNSVQYCMDDILKHCFMLSLKLHGKKMQLPILTSTFYRTYVLNCCPPELNLDIKKTTHKKLSVFLKEMMTDNLVKVKELTKGVESIVEINTEHEEVKSFHVDSKFKDYLKLQKAEKAAEEVPAICSIQENYKFPEIVEMFTVSAQVKAIFECLRIRKGDALPANKVREALRQYVKENSLQSETNPREVVLDPVLAHSLLKSNETKSSMNWEELFEAVVSKMQHAYQITFDGEKPVIKKGQLDPIEVIVAKRTGNKKVTLIHNLENFGINPEKLASHAQVAVAASTSVAPAPNGKGIQVLIQGSQLRFLLKLFLDTYKIPKKYVRGLENATAKKK